MSTKIGVIVGRFQVDNLTRGHNYLLDKVRGDFGNNNVVIFIEETKNSERTAHDPLPFEARKEMILESYPKMKIFKISDLGNYPKWVETLDHRINYLKSLEEIPQDSEIYICGSRDSVAERYKENGGFYNIKIYPDQKDDVHVTYSGTEIRRRIVNCFTPNWKDEKLRKFLIWWYGRSCE
jgi:hypothetical protein